MLAVAGATVGAAAETLTVTLNKSEVLRIGRAASTVAVGQPEIADVQVESPRLVLVLGKSVGETNLLILDGGGDEIANYAVVVVPEADRHVTIHHGGTGVSTLSCNPRCAGVKNPGTEKEPEQQSGGGGASGGGGGSGGSPNLSSTLSDLGAGATSAVGNAVAGSPQSQGGGLSPGATVKQGEAY